MSTAIADYDTPGYDYRTYWDDRRYEQWAEDHALHRVLPRLGQGRWFIDFGGGFGRNTTHYRERYDRYVIADYSATNLTNAARHLRSDIDAGRAYLVRCDLLALPFVDAAFDAAMVVRVLHHLADIDPALVEMGRTVAGRWLLDVPIKHHALATVRSAVRGQTRRIHGPSPLPTGTSEHRFWNFQLAAVRRTLSRTGWHTEVAASVNNLRRWDRGALPAPLVRALQPGARVVEAVAQHAGRRWWGPNQFVLAERNTPQPAATPPTHQSAATPHGARVPNGARTAHGAPAIAERMICPACHGTLHWLPDLATCQVCDRRYPHTGAYWDFTR